MFRFTEASDHDEKSLYMVKGVTLLLLPVVLDLNELLTSSKIIATLNQLCPVIVQNN